MYMIFFISILQFKNCHKKSLFKTGLLLQYMIDIILQFVQYYLFQKYPQIQQLVCKPNKVVDT